MDKKSEYALRAATYLAAHYQREETVNTSEIAGATGAPRKYLAHILLSLKNRALVSSTAGRNGGYRLMRRPELLSVAEILDAIKDGSQADEEADDRQRNASGLLYRAAGEIASSAAENAVHEALSKLSLADVLEESRKEEENFNE